MAFGVGDISLSDFVQQFPAFKYIIFLGILSIGAVELDLGITKFRIGEIFFFPFQFVLNGIGIKIDFLWFYILCWVVALVIFVRAMDK